MRGAVWPWLALGLAAGGALVALALAQRDERMLVAGYAVLGVCALAPVVGQLMRRRDP